MAILLRITVLLCLCCPLLVPDSAEAATASRPTLAVMPFAPMHDTRETWLGVAVADRLRGVLADSGQIRVVERAQLQAFLEEMELQDAGFANPGPGTLHRIGRVAGADMVMYGHYRLEGAQLSITALRLRLQDGALLHTHTVEGALKELPQLVERLAAAFTEKNVQKTTGTPSAALSPPARPTDSVPAMRYFYRAMQHYDRGEYEEAFAGFTNAERQDPDFREAALWKGIMLQSMEQPAMAAPLFTALADAYPQTVEGRDAQLFAGRILAAHAPDAAAARFRALAEQRPLTPHGLEAAWEWGKLLEAQEKDEAAYRAYAIIESFRNQWDDHRIAATRKERRVRTAALKERFVTRIIAQVRSWLGRAPDTRAREAAREQLDFLEGRLGVRHSRFTGWPQALEYYRPARIAMTQLLRRLPSDPARTLPRGVFVVDPAHPVITADGPESVPSFFMEHSPYPDWNESVYAVVLPQGYTATGVHAEVSGRQFATAVDRSFGLRIHSFPLPREHQNSAFGAIYGQTTQPSTLRKDIPFYGERRGVFSVYLHESHGTIHGWKLRVNMKQEDDGILQRAESAGAGSQAASRNPARFASANQQDDGNVSWEGQPVAFLPTEEFYTGSTLPLHLLMQKTRRRMALLNHGRDGIYLVFTRGSLAGGQTDLWMYHSPDGAVWEEPVALPVNSLSQDTAPQLVAGEDGTVHLFWLSTRRGLGWELFTSRHDPATGGWSDAAVIPLPEQPSSSVSGGDMLKTLLTPPPYAVMQDARGRWVLAAAAGRRRIVLLRVSSDLQRWETVSRRRIKAGVAALGVTQDAAQRYWLATADRKGAVRVDASNHLKAWTLRHTLAEGGVTPSAANYPLTFLEPAPGRLTLLVSDTITGLQYAPLPVTPGIQDVPLDLVRASGLQAYAAARGRAAGETLVALQGPHGIHLRRYRAFAAPDNPANDPRQIIYAETLKDNAASPAWRHIFARQRFRVPDVTAVGAQADGTIWWGIETGLMGLHGATFLFADVSQGFFHNTVTHIVPCGEHVYLASRYLEQPVVALVQRHGILPRPVTHRLELSGASGAVTALTCDGENSVFIGTAAGDIITLHKGIQEARRSIGTEAITALLADKKTATSPTLWVATAAGGIGRLQENGRLVATPGVPASAVVTHMVRDTEGTIWAATQTQGMYRLPPSGAMQRLTQQNGTLPYASIGILTASPHRGIWFLPGSEEESHGVGHHDGTRFRLFQSARQPLTHPVDMTVDGKGNVWIGTAFDGIYVLETQGEALP